MSNYVVGSVWRSQALCPSRIAARKSARIILDVFTRAREDFSRHDIAELGCRTDATVNLLSCRISLEPAIRPFKIMADWYLILEYIS